MKVIVAGGTGFLGRALSNALIAAGHDVVILSRGSAADSRPTTSGEAAARFVAWTPDGSSGAWASHVDGADAVVNLAGESIAAKRWTNAQKQRIGDSRLLATRSLVAAVRAAATPPPVFVSGSAVGYYGPLGDEIATEDTPAGSDFLAQLCVHWEAEAWRAASARTRVVCIRTGVVLERDGGALPPMLTPFRLFVGGPVGSGRQYLPWIHRDDWIAIVLWAIQRTTVSGAVNATAPTPVTSANFAHALGRVLHRPSFMPAPAFALRLLLGEMADALLLSGQRAVPAIAEREGFAFRYMRVDDALAAIFGRA